MNPPCTNWTPIDGINHGGYCEFRKASVSFGVCRLACDRVSQEWKEKKKLPKMSTMVANAATAALRAGKQIVTEGSIIRSKEEIEALLAICRQCPSGHYIKQNKHDRCAKCGCYVNLKVRLQSEHCPVKHW